MTVVETERIGSPWSCSLASEVQKRAYVIADNKLAEKAGWDSALLAAELGDLATLMPTVAFDWPIEITGFSAGEIEVLGHDAIARIIRVQRRRPHHQWHLDEVFIRIGGRQMYLWRTVDAEG